MHYKHLEKQLPICCNGGGRKGRTTNNPCWSVSKVHSQTGSRSRVSRSLLTGVLDPHTSVLETSSEQHFLLLVFPKFPNFPAKWRPWYANRSHDPLIYCLPSALRFLHSAAAREQPVKELFIKFILTLSNEIWGNYIRTTEHQTCSKYMSLLC